jgi:hypothetical protein
MPGAVAAGARRSRSRASSRPLLPRPVANPHVLPADPRAPLRRRQAPDAAPSGGRCRRAPAACSRGLRRADASAAAAAVARGLHGAAAAGQEGQAEVQGAGKSMEMPIAHAVSVNLLLIPAIVCSSLLLDSSGHLPHSIIQFWVR